MAEIRTARLVKEYRPGRGVPVRALDAVDLEIATGTFAAILGRSGSGKSTLLNLVGGLDRPTSGEVRVDGTDLGGLSDRDLAAFRSRTVGFVFQAFHLQPRFAAWENVALPLLFAGVPRRERRRRAEALLDRVGLLPRLAHRPRELSGGEQQRVALARSLANDPRVLLADEPTGNLDGETSLQILDLVAEVNRRGATVLMVTHDRALAQARATRILRMVDGRLAPPGEEIRG